MGFRFWNLRLTFGILFYISFQIPIFAQFQGYDETNGSPYLAGLFSKGTAVSDPMGSLYGNISFLSQQKQNFLDFGTLGSYANQSYGSAILSASAYFQMGETWGFGFRGKPIYQRAFPTNSKFNNYAIQGFLSKSFTKQLSFGIAVGPGISGRPGGYSSYSWNVSTHVSYIIQNFKLGLVLESPGSYRYDRYLGSERLVERLPERVMFGLSYELTESLQFYAEGIRTFWERATFDLNKNNEMPAYPVNTMYTYNFGTSYGNRKEFQVLGGFGTEGKPTAERGIKQLYGGSIGVAGGLFPDTIGNGYYYAVTLQRLGFGVSEEEGAETRFGFQLQSQFGDSPKN